MIITELRSRVTEDKMLSSKYLEVVVGCGERERDWKRGREKKNERNREIEREKKNIERKRGWKREGDYSRIGGILSGTHRVKLHKVVHPLHISRAFCYCLLNTRSFLLGCVYQWVPYRKLRVSRGMS